MNKNYILVIVICLQNQRGLEIEKQRATSLKLSRLTFAKIFYKSPIPQYISVMKTTQLMLYRETIGIHYEDLRAQTRLHPANPQ
jgi:hypothetical protein